MAKTETQRIQEKIVTNELHDIHKVIIALRKKTGKEWTIWGVNYNNLSSQYQHPVLVGYQITKDMTTKSTVWESTFGSVKAFLQEKLNEINI